MMILSILPESETPLQKLVLKTSKIWILLKSINITKLKLPPTFSVRCGIPKVLLRYTIENIDFTTIYKHNEAEVAANG